jgi:urate oxidase
MKSLLEVYIKSEAAKALIELGHTSQHTSQVVEDLLQRVSTKAVNKLVRIRTTNDQDEETPWSRIKVDSEAVNDLLKEAADICNASTIVKAVENRDISAIRGINQVLLLATLVEWKLQNGKKISKTELEEVDSFFDMYFFDERSARAA